MKALLRSVPQFVGLIARLVIDPVLPRPAKLALAAAAVYLVSPIDLLPDVLPFLGYVDDLLLVSVVVDGIVNYVDRRLVLRYWPGTPESLEALGRAAHLLARWVPGRVKTRIFSLRP